MKEKEQQRIPETENEEDARQKGREVDGTKRGKQRKGDDVRSVEEILETGEKEKVNEKEKENERK